MVSALIDSRAFFLYAPVTSTAIYNPPLDNAVGKPSVFPFLINLQLRKISDLSFNKKSTMSFPIVSSINSGR